MTKSEDSMPAAVRLSRFGRWNGNAADLNLIPGSVVEECNFFRAPGQLACQFHQNEPLEERPELTSGPQDAAGVRADLVCCDTGVDERELGGCGCSATDVSGPRRYPLDEKDLFEQCNVLLHRRGAESEFVAQCGDRQRLPRSSGQHLNQCAHLGCSLDLRQLLHITRDEIAQVGIEKNCVVGGRWFARLPLESLHEQAARRTLLVKPWSCGAAGRPR